VRAYLRMLFKEVLLDNAAASDQALEEFLKKNDSVELALRAILAFRPIAPIDSEKDLSNYKIMVENALMAA